MKIKMIFDLPDDEEDFSMAANAGKMNIVLFDFDQWLRSQIKYSEDIKASKHDILQDCRDKFHELLRENNIDL
jgi:hypothetical protein